MRCAKMQNVAPCLLIPYGCARWPLAQNGRLLPYVAKANRARRAVGRPRRPELALRKILFTTKEHRAMLATTHPLQVHFDLVASFHAIQRISMRICG